MSDPGMTPEELIARRDALGLTAEELATRLGVSRVTVWRWEQGKRAIPSMLDLALQTLEREKRRTAQ